jgi:hypothetical protein
MSIQGSNPEVDLHFLKYILKYVPQNTMIEFCGGEPGLLINLEEAFEIVYTHPNVKAVQIMSNGLVRLRNFDFLENENVYYCEHLIKDIDNKNVGLFYDTLCIINKPRWRYVVVTTESTTDSLLNYYDYYKKLGFFRDMFWYKIMNPKTHGVNSFVKKLEILFKKLKNDNYLDANFTLERIDAIKGLDPKVKTRRSACGLNSPQPTIDFETKELVHCGAYLEDSQRHCYHPDLFEKHLRCQLFNPGKYCKECYIYMNNQYKSILDCRSGNYYNMEV